MLNRTLIALPLLAALSTPALAQPAVPAVPPLPARPAAAPAARPAPVSARPAPAPVAAPSADDPPTSAPSGPVASAPIPVTAAPAFTPAPVTRPAGVPAVAAAAPPSASDAPPTTSAAPTTTAVASAPSSLDPPTTDAAAATPPIPTADSLQTVTKNYPLTPEGNARFLATYATLPGVKTLDGGVMVRALVTGKGTTSPIGRLDNVTVTYRGWMVNGTSFDATQPGVPRTFQLAQLIEGWRTALVKMKTGDLWEIVVPAALAYGAEGRSGIIPPNQVLIFVVSLGRVEYSG